MLWLVCVEDELRELLDSEVEVMSEVVLIGKGVLEGSEMTVEDAVSGTILPFVICTVTGTSDGDVLVGIVRDDPVLV